MEDTVDSAQQATDGQTANADAMAPEGTAVATAPGVDEASVKQLVQKLTKRIKKDKAFHEKAFKRMRRDMFVAMHGREESWPEGSYSANIVGRHIRQKTSSLYAKNPKIVARRRDTLDFQLWDEDEHSIKLAMAIVQQAAMATAQAAAIPPQIDPASGMEVPVPAQLPPGFEQAQQLIADFQQGMARRVQAKKIGRTLEVLFAQAMREQKPLDFKRALKKVVRRACTTGVAYCEVGFQRETGPRPVNQEKLTDFRARIDHLRNLAEQAASGEIESPDAEIAELEAAAAALTAEPEIVLREGLTFDFPVSTKVIPDRATSELVGFVGAGHLTIEYPHTKDSIKEIFKVDIGDKFTTYKADKTENEYENGVEREDDNDEEGSTDQSTKPARSESDIILVWKHYEKASGLVYYMADGFDGFLRPPASPDVFVSDFWPVYALTFNDTESESELFPPSDATLLLNMQREYNRSRQGKREHRDAARPRWVYANGALDPPDIELLKTAKAFEAIGLGIAPGSKISDVLQELPVPGVDPNLYDVNEVWSDAQAVGGMQQAMLGGLAKATATESAISANSTASGDGSSVDDLDSFLTCLARAGGQILMRESSAEQVAQVVGPGAVWPEESMTDICNEIALEVEMGSSGKPNQAVEISNWKEMLPFLLQMGSIPSTWLARETLRRLDDRMDLTEAVVDGLPSLVAQNAMAQPSTGNAASDPNAQGGKGAENAPAAPGGPAGTGPAFGSNQV